MGNPTISSIRHTHSICGQCPIRGRHGVLVHGRAVFFHPRRIREVLTIPQQIHTPRLHRRREASTDEAFLGSEQDGDVLTGDLGREGEGEKKENQESHVGSYFTVTVSFDGAHDGTGARAELDGADSMEA